MSALEIKNLHASIEEKKIPKGVNLTMKTRETYAIMGPNGTGRSTLLAAIIGNPNCEVAEGGILFDEKNVLNLEIDRRIRLGLFSAMQYPSEIPGIMDVEFTRAVINARRDRSGKISVMAFLEKLDEEMTLLNMSGGMAERYLNEGLSGGKKKRNEILQLLMPESTFAALGEIDSGLGIDVLKVVTKEVSEMRGDSLGALIITYYQRLLNHITPDVVHTMMEGQVVMIGNTDLAKRLETEGYAGISKELEIDYKEEET